MSNIPDCLPPHSASALITFSVKDYQDKRGRNWLKIFFNEISELTLFTKSGNSEITNLPSWPKQHMHID